MKRNINNLVKRYEKLEELENSVSNEYLGNSSFYLLPTGQYLNTICDYGCRCQDHRVIFGATRINVYDNNAFGKLQCNYQIVRVVPESNILMIDKKQKLTYEQKQEINNLINYYNFEVEYYID